MRVLAVLLLVACSSDPRPGPSDASADAAVDADVDASVLDASTDASVDDAATDTTFDSALDSGPASTPGAGDLVVVEIQGNPVTATDEEAEYIELLNVSGRPLELMGVTLAHVAFSGGEPSASTATHVIASSVIASPGERLLLGRSSGGFFGDATPDYVYEGFVFGNGSETNRLRLLLPGWDGTEPVPPVDLIDEVQTEVGVFDNAMRGRAWALDPALVPSPSAALNDLTTNWCSASGSAVEYRANNFGTPGETNACN